MEKEIMISEINRLKKEKNAIILAHNYQVPEVQDIADFIGDSLKLSQIAAETEKDMIIFCGVHFMAESAKILSPGKRVFLPARDAGCPMADMITGAALQEYKKENPNTTIVTYVNSSADVKAHSDVCCTSSNAYKVVEQLETNDILFAPDRNLGSYIAKDFPEKDIKLWRGFCITHERVEAHEVDDAREKHKGAEVLVHPECNPKVVEKADFVGSTSQIIDYAVNSENKEFIIGTEMGILHCLKEKAPDKKFYILSDSLVCQNMKKTGLEHVYDVLLNETNEITVDDETREKALVSLQRMLDVNA